MIAPIGAIRGKTICIQISKMLQDLKNQNEKLKS